MTSQPESLPGTFSADGRFRIDVRSYPPMQQGDTTEDGQLLVEVATGHVLLEAMQVQCNAQIAFGPDDLVTLRVPGWRGQVWEYRLDPARRVVAAAAHPEDWRPLAELRALVNVPSQAEAARNLAALRAQRSLRAGWLGLALCVASFAGVVFLPLPVNKAVRVVAGSGVLLVALYLVFALRGRGGRR